MKLRSSNLDKLTQRCFDVLIVGGGINGAVSASALAARGASVALIDAGDFAGGTSQHSSNLAWGGIKYMESWEFPLVRELCVSRNHLMRSYPSTVQEIRFYTTIERGFRWHPLMLYLGTWLYWLIGNGFTRMPRFLTASRIQAEEPQIRIDRAAGGFEYSDAYLHDNDARFVWNFIRMAMNRGCIAANYVRAVDARRENGRWRVSLEDQVDGKRFELSSRLMINAAGPWADGFNKACGVQSRHQHLLSKGIHLIVDRISQLKQVLAFFADDGRLFFAIPMGNRTCIGTTDTPVKSPDVRVTDEDRQFVLDNVNRCLRLPRPLSREDIIAERCGVRPLAVAAGEQASDDFLQLSRKHALDVDARRGQISIFGGKLTDCLNVGDEVSRAVEELGVALPHRHFRWYGEPSNAVRKEFFHQARLMNLDAYTAPESCEPLSTRLWRRYGSQAIPLLENIREDPREAEVLIKGTEYIRCELRQAARREMVVKLSDFLRRRSKIALVERDQTIRAAPGLMEACRILFGEQAEARIAEYFDEPL